MTTRTASSWNLSKYCRACNYMNWQGAQICAKCAGRKLEELPTRWVTIVEDNGAPKFEREIKDKGKVIVIDKW